MARADLLVHLVRAASEGDDARFQSTVESLISEEREKQHHVLAERLEDVVRNSRQSPNLRPGRANGFTVVNSTRQLEDLILPESALATIAELVEEQQRVEILRANGLEPRHRVLLTGPPGNGKTSLAEAIAEKLIVPLVRIRYEEIIGSYLGETAERLAEVFAFARTRRCVLFFDEFDALAKERGDIHETGEIKRVVSSLLLQVDALPSHVITVAASNHPELLDRAVHRRFEIRLELGPPNKAARILWAERMASDVGEPLGIGHETFARKTAGASYSQLEDLSNDVKRRLVLQPGSSVRRTIADRITQWREVCALEANG